MRLSTRFALSGAALVAVLVLFAGLLILRLVSHDLTEERDRQLSVRLRALKPLAANYAQRVQADRPRPASVTAERLTGAALAADSPGGLRVSVDGRPPLIIGTGPGALPGRSAGPATATSAGKKWRYVTTRLGPQGRFGQLWVYEPDERLGERLSLLRRGVLVTTLVALIVGSGAGFAVGRLAGRPLSRLRRQAVALDPPEKRLATDSGAAEVDELARILNQLLDRRDSAVTRTGEALETARAFAATAAHEMRTPLTSIGANLSLLNRPDLDAEDQTEILSDLGAEHARLQGMITILRQLALGELIDPSSFTDVDLAELVDAAVEDARRRLPDASITLSLRDEPTVRGWPEGLRMIVDNLLDNAACHGRGGDGRADVTLTLGSRDHAVILGVEDRGDGIPPGDRHAVFDRFQRRPGSPGSGLGLTLVNQQTALHRGHVAIGSPPGGQGTRIEIRLPVAARASTQEPAPSWLTLSGARGTR